MNADDFLNELNNLADECREKEDNSTHELCSEYGQKIKSIADSYYEEEGISTIAVFADPKSLDHAFIGGILCKHDGTSNQLFQIFYQLMKALFDTLAEDTNHDFAVKIFKQLTQSVIDGDEFFNVEKDLEKLKQILKSLLDRLHEDENDD